MNRPKRLAADLCKLYPLATLAQCQQTAAHLLGHRDWVSLHLSVAQCQSSGQPDEALDPKTLSQRRTAQAKLLAQELADVAPAVKLPKPNIEPANADALFNYTALPVSEVAQQRWHALFAHTVVDEFAPSQTRRPRRRSYPQSVAHHPLEDLPSLPNVLARWWQFNVKYASALEGDALDPNSLISILVFARRWGALCCQYGDRIHPVMVTGVAFILAERYAVVSSYRSGLIDTTLRAVHKAKTPEEEEDLADLMVLGLFQRQTDLMEAFPREDLYAVFRKQPDLFVANADVVRQILASPRSRKGLLKAT